MEDAVAHYVQTVAGQGEDCNWQTRIVTLPKGVSDVHDALTSWLKTPFWHLDRSFSQVQDYSPFADLIIERFRKMGIVHLWRLQITKPEGEFLKPFYETSWDDFLIQAPEGFLLLHLGVST